MSIREGEAIGEQRQGGEPYCRAEDLKDILQHLAGQIAELDRRHTGTLREMYNRLAELGGQAEQAKSSLPPVFVPAFERIEESLGQLAERIVEADRQRHFVRAPEAGAHEQAITAAAPHDGHAHAAAAPAPAHAPDAGALADADRPAAPVGPQPVPVAFVARPEPAPLRSALAGGAAVAADAPHPRGLDQWDRESAEALAMIYENGEAGSLREGAAPPVMGLAAMPAAAPRGIDRDWLEERLQAISQGIEDSLSGLSPERSMQALGVRFDQLEERFANAIEGVAQRSDVEGLRLVEAHINEMLSQLDSTHAQLERLGTLETQIVDLRKQLSNESVADLVAQAMPTGDELTSFAETAAERAAERVAERVAQQIVANLPAQPAGAVAAAAAPVEGERIERLHGLLETFMDERRRGEEMTAGMLDTMQQAMQHLLDRVESLELGYQHAAAQMAAPAHDMHMAADDPQGQAMGLAVEPGPMMGEAGPAPAGMRPLPEPHMPHDRIEPQFAPEPAAAPAAAAIEPQPHGRPAQAAPSNRDDFIAAARRAARQLANEQADAAPAAAKGASARSQAPKAMAAAAASGRGKLFSGNGGSRPGVLLVACIAALLVTGGFMLYGKQFRLGPTAAPKVERKMLTTETEAADKSAAEKSREAEEGAAPGPQPQPPVKQQSGDQNDDLGGVTKGQGERSADAGGDGSLGPSVAAILKAQQHQRMAQLSQQLGQQSAAEGAGIAAPVAASAVAVPVVGQGQEAGEMPPAAIGPTSLRVAAQKGDPSAQFEVAARFAEGKGVAQDFAQAMAWYHKAAAQGFAPAQYRLANLYERGIGVTADLPRARAWYKRAADLGHVKAMHNLAVISSNRAAGAPDYQGAAMWFRRAAERGLADSQFNLAVLLDTGLGIAADPGEAYRWFSIAARSGDREALKRRDQVRAKVAPETARAIDAEVAAWRPSPVDMMINDPRVAGDAWRRRAVAAPG